MGFAELAADISSWANGIQNELKAQEELQNISPAVFHMLKAIPASERDVTTLLKFNTTLDWYEGRLKTHGNILKELQKDLFDRTLAALKQAKSDIKKILAAKKESSAEKRERRAKNENVQKTAPAPKELIYAKDKVKNVLEAISLIDIEINENTRKLIEYLDQEVIKQKLTESEYSEFLEELVDYLEEII
jgi:hypothetical protein